MVWYVNRVNGKINAIAPAFAPGIAEEGPLPDDDPDVLLFLNPPAPPYILGVDVMWGRMTDDEAEEFDSEMSTATPLRLRKQFNTSMTLTEGTELMNFVKTVLERVFTVERAAVLIGPVVYSSRTEGEESGEAPAEVVE